MSSWLGPLAPLVRPHYCRLDIGPVLTPVQADAGADMAFTYATEDGSPLDLYAEDLPSKSWPAPRGPRPSPFSLGAKDYVRPAGPGVYVGCGYRRSDGGKGPASPASYVETEFVYFMLVKRV